LAALSRVSTARPWTRNPDHGARTVEPPTSIGNPAEERNKALVLEAFDTLFNRRDYAAAQRFWSPDYIQHSAHIEPGRDGLFDLIKAAPAEMRYENALTIANGDYVMLHGRFSNTGYLPTGSPSTSSVCRTDCSPNTGMYCRTRQPPRNPRADCPCSATPSRLGPDAMTASMKISAQFATSLHSPDHIADAERLGYDRAWLFDIPHEARTCG